MTPERAADDRRRRFVLRHHDGAPGDGRRDGQRRRAHHGAHHPAVVRDHQDRAGYEDRVQRLPDVPVRPGAGLRRLRGEPGSRRPRNSRTSPSPPPAPRLSSASTPGSRCCPIRRAPPAPVPTSRRSARQRISCTQLRPDLLVEGPIQYDAAVDPPVAIDEAAGLAGGRPGDGVDLPGPEHRQQHVQGGAAQRERGGDRAGPAGPEQAGQRPVPRRAGGDIVNTVAITPFRRKRSGAKGPFRRKVGPFRRKMGPFRRKG